jgi:hypothetical protein
VSFPRCHLRSPHQWSGLIRAVRRGVRPRAHRSRLRCNGRARPGLDHLPEQRTKYLQTTFVLYPMCLVLASPATQEWISLAALPPCSNRRLSESWRWHWLRRCHLIDYTMCQLVAQSAIRPRTLRTSNVPIAVVLRKRTADTQFAIHSRIRAADCAIIFGICASLNL